MEDEVDSWIDFAVTDLGISGDSSPPPVRVLATEVIHAGAKGVDTLDRGGQRGPKPAKSDRPHAPIAPRHSQESLTSGQEHAVTTTAEEEVDLHIALSPVLLETKLEPRPLRFSSRRRHTRQGGAKRTAPKNSSSVVHFNLPSVTLPNLVSEKPRPPQSLRQRCYRPHRSPVQSSPARWGFEPPSAPPNGEVDGPFRRVPVDPPVDPAVARSYNGGWPCSGHVPWLYVRSMSAFGFRWNTGKRRKRGVHHA